MKNLKIMTVVVFFLAFGWVAAPASTISLSDLAFNINGSVTEGSISSGFSSSGFNLTTGLGLLTWTTMSPGQYSVIAFFDHEIDEKDNTFFKEFGAANGTPVAGQSWEIDEPGYVFGDIYDNVLDGVLDSTNSVPDNDPDDVSMAMGFNFSLAANQTATIKFILGLDPPTPGFYLSQRDTDSSINIYFSSSLTIEGGGTPPDDDDINPIPEPGTWMLLCAGLAGMLGMRLRKRHQS